MQVSDFLDKSLFISNGYIEAF